MNKKCHTFIPRRLRPLALAVACALSGPVFAQNLPGGFTNVQGVDTPTTVGNTMTVTQTTQRGIAEWQSFSIGNGYSVIFNQPGTSSVLLNRVVGNDSSKIAGNLSANGQIYLINPNGVLFSQGSSVNVGGLIASTLNISNNDFLTGGALKFSRADNNDAAVTNEGSITATDGSIALMAARVTNSGTLSASGGTVGLVSARTVNVDFDGDGLTTFTIPDDSLASAAWVENSGQVDADGGRIVLLAASTVREQVVKQSGTLRARSLSNRGGEIVLGGDTSSGNEVLVGGEIDVSGNDAGVAGGTVSVEASTVLVDGARIDASGVGQGGRVAVNGGNVGLFNGSIDASGTVQGGSIDVRAKTNPNQGDNGIIAMDKDFSLHADATGSQGSGGQIILLADAVTRAHGVLTARAGSQGGDGGLIETSGDVLELSGIHVDASAPAGKAGEWLLDPYGVGIYHGGGSGSSLPSNPFISTSDSTIVYDGDINYNLNRGTSVTIRTGEGGPSTGGYLIFEGDARIEKTSGGNATLTLVAHNRIGTIDVPGIYIRSTSGALNVVFDAGVGVYLSGAEISTNGGYVTFRSPGIVSVNGSTIQTGGGSITLAGGEGVSLNDYYGSSVYPLTISGGRIDITGSAGSSPGLYIGSGSTIKSTGDVVLRASSSYGMYALVINGQVEADGVLNLRPVGESEWIVLGYNSSGASFMSVGGFNNDNLKAPTIVVGSSTHNGHIWVTDSITTVNSSSALTLQNGSGGITLSASVNAPTLGLVSAGPISQNSGVIAANNLFARSSGGEVSLQGYYGSINGNNVGTLSGGAGAGAGSLFEFTNVGALRIGPVSVTGYNGANNSRQTLSTGTLTANTVMVKANTGDLTLAMPVSSASGTDLIAINGVFQNPGSGSISGPWRVWATTWEGETRGGMAGTANNLPNIYGCNYDQRCYISGVTIPETGNHFIYLAQPTTTVTVNDTTRFVGMDYLAPTFTVNGLFFPADKSSFDATFSTTATASSPVGDYPVWIDSVTSRAGHIITYRYPATLHVIPEPIIEKPPAPEAAFTYAFMPVCLRTDEFDSTFKAVLDSDALAHEWARLRSRPRISNCLGVSDQRRGCADF